MCQYQQFYVKGMVCQRCVFVVERELRSLPLPNASVTLGQVSFQHEITNDTVNAISQILEMHGFQVLADRQSMLVQKVKAIIDEMFKDGFDLMDFKFSKYIAYKLHKDYDSISSSFSMCQGVTIEKYILSKRLDKVKQQLAFSNQSLTEISYSLGFSSVAHLSRQFKEMTQITPSAFRETERTKPAPAA